MVKLMFLAAAVLVFSSCSQFNSETQSANPDGEIRIGDMIIAPHQLGSSEIQEKGFNLKLVVRWPEGILRYQFDAAIPQNQRQAFLQYCREMGEFAKIQCLPRRSSDKDYINIMSTEENICGLSNLGKIGGRQNLKIKCWQRRTIQHELMHAFGISHEHNRPDRDDFLEIHWENIYPALKHDFIKVNLLTVNKMINVYDFNSVMHYGSYSGSRNGKIVLYKKEKGPQAGQIQLASTMSYYDHYTLYALYGGVKPH